MKKIKLFGVMLLALSFGIVGVKADETLQSLVDAAEEEATIKLEKDYAEIVTIDGKNIVLDMNGHSLVTSGNGVLRVTGGATVTVIGEGLIRSTNNNGVVVYSDSTFVLEDGTIRAQEFGVFTLGGGTFVMNGGTIETVDNCGIGGNGSSGYEDYTIEIHGGTINGHITSAGYIACGIYHPNRGVVNVTGGTINAVGGVGIVQRAGILNITGGTINATGEATGWVGDNKTSLTSSAVVVDKAANYPQVATLETRIAEVAELNSDIEETVATLGEDVNIEVVPAGSGVYQVIGGENDGEFVVIDEEDIEIIAEYDEYDKDDVMEALADAAENYEKAKNGEIELTEEEMAELEVLVKVKEELDKHTVVGFYEISALKVADDLLLDDDVRETDAPIEVTIELPEDLPAVKDGYTRKYYVVRIHDGEVTVIDDVTVNEDGTITFKSDKFSAYALAYDDVAKETVKNADTFDGIISYMIIGLVSTIMVLSASLYLKKRFN